MISWSFNAPKVAFFEEGQFFSDVGVDGLSLHKANESARMCALKIYAVMMFINRVIRKNI